MLIDWFTVIAQAINFLVLIWLMKRFLYKPVLAAIDAREAHIVETVRDAEQQMDASKRERQNFVRKNEDLDHRRDELMTRAREEARAMGEEMLEKERLTVETMRGKWRAALEDERERFGDEAARRVQDEVFALARRVFSDLADTSLEVRMAEVFERRLRQAWNEPGGGLAGTLRSSAAAVRIKSAFELPEERRASLRQILSETFAPGGDVVFETEPGLIGGIELTVGGQRLVWTVSDYLDELKSGVSYAPAGSTPVGQIE